MFVEHSVDTSAHVKYDLGLLPCLRRQYCAHHGQDDVDGRVLGTVSNVSSVRYCAQLREKIRYCTQHTSVNVTHCPAYAVVRTPVVSWLPTG